MKLLSENKCFSGYQRIYQHASTQTKTDMRFSVFLPEAAINNKSLPVLWFLSGLTCTEENFTFKAGAQRYAAENEIIVIAPDTSPRDANIEHENDSYDLGTGAGFYVDATNSPWCENYRMYSYITKELPDLVRSELSIATTRHGICGHSMGGHGALTIGLKNPDQYHSISAFAPICAPTQCEWGRKALTAYLGQKSEQWNQYDAVELINQGFKSNNEILIDQGAGDDFLKTQLKPELLQQVCKDNNQQLNLRIQQGYDHSYYFISSFIGDHIKFHASLLHQS